MSSIQIQSKSSNIVHTNYIHVLHIILRNEKNYITKGMAHGMGKKWQW